VGLDSAWIFHGCIKNGPKEIIKTGTWKDGSEKIERKFPMVVANER
jgi:hypothetical protein